MGIEYLDKTHAKLVVNKGSGKNRTRRIKRITYKGKKDAERQYREFELSVNFGIDSKMTVGELLEWYIEKFKKNGGKPTTVIGYETCAKTLSRFFSGKKAKDITITDIEHFVASEAKYHSSKTIKNEVSLLSAAYKSAIRRGALVSNPCEYALTPKQQKKDIIILSDFDIEAFCEALDSESIDFKVMCELALFCGLRRSEIFGLYKQDVGATVTINKVRHRLNKRDVIETPKTVSSIRTLAVPRFILSDIEALKKSHAARPVQSDFLILNGFGEPVSASWATRGLSNFTRRNNLPHVTMHGLRHTCASMLINDGIPIAEVSAQLGHASIDITLRTYTHLFTDASTASKRISQHIENRMAPLWHQKK